MIIITSTITICISIIFIVLYIAKLSKTNNIREKLADIKNNVVIFILYCLGFAALLVILKENEIFDIFKYIGICVYWIFWSVAFFTYFNLLVYYKKDINMVYIELCAELKKRVLLISTLTILWIISNVLLEKSLYIVISFPIVMTVIMINLLIKFIIDKKSSNI